MVERHLHRARRAFAVGRRRGHVIGVAGKSVAGEFAPDFRAARFGVLEFFDHHHAGAFAHDESVAIAIERPRGALRFVVARAERFHRGETRRGRPE